MPIATTAPAHHAAYLGQRTFGSLDGLRAISILGVVWHHAGPETGPLGMSRGFLGVDLFFVISGYLIVTLLLRERTRTGSISLGAFYARRMLRIFPLYYGVLLALTLLYGTLGRAGWPAFRHDAVVAFFYLSNWLPMGSLLAITWSLAAEEQFYLVWPFVEKTAGRATGFVLAVALVVTAGLQLLGAHTDVAPDLPPFLAQTSFTPILLGVALAHMLHGTRGYQLLGVPLRHPMAAPIGLLLTVGLIGMLPQADISGWPRLAIHLAMVILVGACVVREDHWLAAPLRFRPLARLGTISYGVYLLHQIAQHVTRSILSPESSAGEYGRFLLTLAIAWLMAELSFRLYETPFLRLKERWSR